MSTIFYQMMFLLLFAAVQLYSQELWRFYKSVEHNGPDSVVFETKSYNQCFLIDNDTLTGYGKQLNCYEEYSYAIDSIKNDSIFSSSFFSRKRLFSIIIRESLYFS